MMFFFCGVFCAGVCCRFLLGGWVHVAFGRINKDAPSLINHHLYNHHFFDDRRCNIISLNVSVPELLQVFNMFHRAVFFWGGGELGRGRLQIGRYKLECEERGLGIIRLFCTYIHYFLSMFWT